MKAQPPEAVLRPGAGEWELWKFPPKGAPTCEFAPSDKVLSAVPRLVLAMPARDLVAVPLWISPEADPVELAELELTSRHLLRRNAAVHAIRLETRDERALILALASSDDAKSSPFFPAARSFEASARLWDPGDADAVIWRELGEICFAFFTSRRCVFFSATGETSPGPAFCGVFSRSALRLKAEGVVPRTPAMLRVFGDFPEAELASLAGTLRVDLEFIAAPTPPRLPDPLSNPAPPIARIAESRRVVRNKLAKVGAFIAAAYLAIVAVLAADFVLRSRDLGKLQTEIAQLAPVATEARQTVTEWREFRHAVDPESYALDQLAAIAREVPGEQVRLTQVALENGRLLISGEAADVAQAYALFEKIKVSPALQQYDWTARQPQLAGKSKVRFEMEGVRPDAKTNDQ